MEQNISQKKPDLDKSIDFFQQEISAFRTDRANPVILESLSVEVYGVQTPLKQLANISVASAQSLIIQPWDISTIKEIAKAIQNSDLNLSPAIEDKQIRINLPPLTEERRLELIKSLHQKAEQAKVSIRNVREEIIKQLKGQKENKDLSEDQYFQAEKELQQLIKEYNQKVEDLTTVKEKDLQISQS